MIFESVIKRDTHDTVAGMPSLPQGINRVTLEAGEWLEVVVNTKGGPKKFNLISSGYVVGFEEEKTEDCILFKHSDTVAILNGKVVRSSTQK